MGHIRIETKALTMLSQKSEREKRRKRKQRTSELEAKIIEAIDSYCKENSYDLGSIDIQAALINVQKKIIKILKS